MTADHLKDSGVEYVMIGHSDRRQLFGETEEQTTLKLASAADSDLNIIYCVGETNEVH